MESSRKSHAIEWIYFCGAMLDDNTESFFLNLNFLLKTAHFRFILKL